MMPPAATQQAAEVSWFDIREITLGPGDLADLDVRETARAAAFVFPADRRQFAVGRGLLRTILGRYLDRDDAADVLVPGAVDTAHAALADLLDEDIGPEDVPRIGLGGFDFGGQAAGRADPRHPAAAAAGR